MWLESRADSRWRAWGLIVVATLLLRLPVLVQPFFYAQDEATYSALAGRILAGATPFIGAVDHKPPGAELTYAAVYRLFGSNHITSIHLVLLLVVVLTAVALSEVATAIAGGPWSRWAGVLYAVGSTLGPPGDTQAANTELFLNLPLTLAAWCVAASLLANRRGQATGWVLMPIAGALTGLAAFYKYQAAIAGLAWVAAILWERARWPTSIRWMSALAIGFGATAAAYCGWFLWHGAWEALTFWGWRFNFAYINDLAFDIKLQNALFYMIVMGAFWSPLLALAFLASGTRRHEGLTIAWLVAGVVILSIGGRFFPHSYLMALPPLVLVALPGRIAEGGEARARRLAHVAAVLAAVSIGVSGFMAWRWLELKPGLHRSQEAYSEVGAYIRTHSTRDASVFVWGNSSPIYYFADRAMGTRFPFCNYQTGKIWGTPADDLDAGDTSALVVPRAWTELLEDLDRTPPTFIVDAGAGHLDRFDQHPATRYAALRLRLERYRLEAVIAGVPVYRLRAGL
jgi:4-amino-4-deoxy-L-arabinose transferase-like glycosyltransferase